MLTDAKSESSLCKLLENLLVSTDDQPIAIAEKMHLIELAAVLADMHAQQATNTLRNLARLFPASSQSTAYHLLVAPAIASAQVQSESAMQKSEAFRAIHARLCATHPQISGAWNPRQNDLHAYDDIFTYPLGRLLQALPDEITNQTSLTREQIQACRTVATLADRASRIALDGIQTIGELLAIADKPTTPDARIKVGSLIAYLTQEARFMAQNSMEYWDAANNIPCKD